MDNKVMTMKQAISQFVSEGDTVFFGGMHHGEPSAAIHEILRQRIKHLTAIPTLTQGVSFLIGEGLVDKLVHGFTGALYARYSTAGNKAKRNNAYPVQDEYSHFGLCMGLLAGSMGIPFMATRTTVGGDFLKWNPQVKLIECPFTGERIGVIRAINPDVGICHVQKADALGNAQRWGTLGMDRMGLHASKRVIISTERIVDTEEIRRDPNRTLIPGILVSAVVEEPWGAFPTHLAGVYESYSFNLLREIVTEEGYETYMREYVYGVNSWQEYITKTKEQKGEDFFDKLTIKNPIWSEPVRSGY
ncbi:MAG: CoA-transferase [Dehalococcoidia bacterium]